MDIVFRNGTPNDALEASALAARAKASVGYPPHWMEVWSGALTIDPEYLAAHRSIVAVRDDRVVGICVVEIRDTEASLEHLWVAPELQRRGVGRSLVERVLQIAADAGVHRITVEADPSAEAFYARMGARYCGDTPAPMPGSPERTLPLLEFIDP